MRSLPRPRMPRMPRRLRTWLARLVLFAAAAAAVHGAVTALTESRKTFRYARRHSHEDLETARDRLFGAPWTAALREVERRHAENERILFVDDWPRPLGWTYFALFELAPRQLVRFGTIDELEAGRFRRRLPKAVSELVVIPGDGSPVSLLDVAELDAEPLLPKRRRGANARQARP